MSVNPKGNPFPPETAASPTTSASPPSGEAPWYKQPWAVAGARALLGASVLTGLGFFGALQAHVPLQAAEVGAGVTFFGYLAQRGVVEGWIDQRRT